MGDDELPKDDVTRFACLAEVALPAPHVEQAKVRGGVREGGGGVVTDRHIHQVDLVWQQCQHCWLKLNSDGDLGV